MRDEVQQELQRIAQRNGGVLQPKAVVEAARDTASPLHDQFQWDDSEAAEQYRLWQARRLIRVTVCLIDSTEPKSTAKVFVSLSTDRNGGGGYRVLADVLSDQDRRAQLLADAQRELKSFQRRYAILTELADVFAAIEKLQQAA